VDWSHSAETTVERSAGRKPADIEAVAKAIFQERDGLLFKDFAASEIVNQHTLAGTYNAGQLVQTQV
jgi:hypothetical protein